MAHNLRGAVTFDNELLQGFAGNTLFPFLCEHKALREMYTWDIPEKSKDALEQLPIVEDAETLAVGIPLAEAPTPLRTIAERKVARVVNRPECETGWDRWGRNRGQIWGQWEMESWDEYLIETVHQPSLASLGRYEFLEGMVLFYPVVQRFLRFGSDEKDPKLFDNTRDYERWAEQAWSGAPDYEVWYETSPAYTSSVERLPTPDFTRLWDENDLWRFLGFCIE